MGLIFTPLSTMALSEIPRERMAQASGLYNVLRQIGGSFGVAIMGTLLTNRTIYHNTLYGQVVNKYSPAAQNIMIELARYSQKAVGGNAMLSSQRAKALIMSNIGQQAFVSAVDDDFFVASLITLVCVVPILFLRYKRKRAINQKFVPAE